MNENPVTQSVESSKKHASYLSMMTCSELMLFLPDYSFCFCIDFFAAPTVNDFHDFIRQSVLLARITFRVFRP